MSSFDSVMGFDNLWELLIQELKSYGFKSVQYGCAFAPALAANPRVNREGYESDGVGGAVAESAIGFLKTNHTREYLDYFNRNFTVLDNYALVHCFLSEEPLFRHHEETYIDKVQTLKQLQFMRDLNKFGMGVGVTVPIRFGNYGLAGFGLAFDGSANEFDSMWEQKNESLFNVLSEFDEATRKIPENSYYQLSDEQIELLKQLQVFGSPKLALDAVFGDGISSAAGYKKLKKLKEAMHVTEDAHLLIKAQEFKLI